jgi:ADP-ribose pyrophosphatase YjhB (NUDIX family)
MMRKVTAVLQTISPAGKARLSRWLRWPPLHRLMLWGLRLLTPRHRIGVVLVALDEQERVFLLRHVFHPFLPWGLPGGWLERDEDPATGAGRELREETGLRAEIGPVLHVSRDPNPSHVTIAFAARIHPGPMQLSPEIAEAAWIPVTALPPLYSFMQRAIETAVARRKILNGNGQDGETASSVQPRTTTEYYRGAGRER